MGTLTPQQKQARRDLGAQHGRYADPLLAALLALGERYDGPRGTTNDATLAFGAFTRTQAIYVCSKGAGASAAVVDAIERARPTVLEHWTVEATSQRGGGGNYENMHAEMQIVEYIVRTAAVHDYKTDLHGQLAIVCIGKPVCRDCCGWMANHGIPHGGTCGDRSDGGWRHPLTRAGFRGEGSSLYHTPASSVYTHGRPHLQGGGGGPPAQASGGGSLWEWCRIL